MARRSTLRTYQTAARIWMTAALVSLLLPEQARLGAWLPLHLALAGAVSVAIAGAMQNFALTLSAAPDARPGIVWAQFAAVNLGALLVAIGHPSGTGWLLAVGGLLFVGGAVILGWLVARARRIGLNRRHTLPFAIYAAAIVAVIVGATLGALVGSGAIEEPQTWLAFRRAHLTLNVLGWASLTIAGTLVTFLPTVLRIRMPPWHGAATATLSIAGVAGIGSGLAARSAELVAAGSVAFAVGSLGLAWMAVKALRMPRAWPTPVAARHLVAALGWFVIGSLSLPWMAGEGLVRWREPFLAIFVCGWVLQTLLGAWQYLLPMARPGHPDERRAWLAAIEVGGRFQVLALNVGVALLALGGFDAVSAWVVRVGAVLALVGSVLAFLKAWGFAALGRVPAVARRHAATWGA